MSDSLPITSRAGRRLVHGVCAALLRVRAAARTVLAPLGELAPDALREALGEGLGRGPQPHAVVRRYRREPSPLVRDIPGGWRTGKLDAVLRGDFDLIAASQV